jgi:hypothetical protein
MNAYIALQMRKEGFSREIMTETLVHCAPEGQSGQRDWRRYAERITAYAFGIAGDVKLAQGAATKEKARQEQERREVEAQQEDAPQKAPRMRMR